jgi:hypothetical protein
MSNSQCQCAKISSSAEAGPAMAETASTISHRHARLPAILRYRGLDEEAAAATHLIKLETLMFTLQAALDDLDLSVMEIRVPELENTQE